MNSCSIFSTDTSVSQLLSSTTVTCIHIFAWNLYEWGPKTTTIRAFRWLPYTLSEKIKKKLMNMSYISRCLLDHYIFQYLVPFFPIDHKPFSPVDTKNVFFSRRHKNCLFLPFTYLSVILCFHYNIFSEVYYYLVKRTITWRRRKRIVLCSPIYVYPLFIYMSICLCFMVCLFIVLSFCL